MEPDQALRPYDERGVSNEGESSRRGGATWRFLMQARTTPGYGIWDFIHGYVYLRWPYLYIRVGVGEHPLAKLYLRITGLLGKLKPRTEASEAKGSVADHYHGKVMPTEAARRLVMVKENLNIPDLEQIIPYPEARSLILENPGHIAVLDCPCRSARTDPCFPLDVCLIIGEPFASLVLEHHPDKSRRISAEQASEILSAEHERGHVHHAFFKDAMLNRFYAICNCCECCCGAMQAQRNGSPMLASSGYIAQVDTLSCIECGECEEACPFGAIHASTGGYGVDRSVCMGCGICVDLCTQQALELILAPDRGIPLVIEALSDQHGVAS
jgi:Pyruvate/2-oxoacid:ferredoxin oxidoreductase delta subunit